MGLGYAFWTLILITVVFGAFVYLSATPFHWPTFGLSILELTLFGLLGWQVFGPALRK